MWFIKQPCRTWTCFCLVLVHFVVDIGCQDCTFDSGLCNYVQSTSDKVDWSRSPVTQAKNTLPKSDHTSTNTTFPFQMYSLVVKAKSCTGSYTWKNSQATIGACALACTGFRDSTGQGVIVYGTNEHGNNRCTSTGCQCYCYPAPPVQNGTCKPYDHKGYNIYRLHASYYMYLEGSSTSTRNAVLLSPQISTGPKCVSFWYHMAGQKIGSLNIYSYKSNTLGKALWTKSGTQGVTAWMFGQVPIPDTTPFQVGIEATQLVWNNGHIAFDDIKITDGVCTALGCEEMNIDLQGGDVNYCQATTSTWQLCSAACRARTDCTHWTWVAQNLTHVFKGQCCLKDKAKYFYRKVLVGLISGDADCGRPNAYIGKCSFEKDECGFTDGGADFKWIRTNGAAGSKFPPKDKTDGTDKGYYLTPDGVKDKIGRVETKYANLAASGSCLTFWYYLNPGWYDKNYKLNVYLNRPATAGTPVWSMDKDHNLAWQFAEINVKMTSVTVQFESLFGTSGDIHMAIDDVDIKAGLCDAPGECDFQSGLCTWNNARSGDQFDWIVNSGSTPSGSTGPSSDRKGDQNGKYIYIEASYPRKQGDQARLTSEQFTGPTAGDQCFLFWYHMQGSGIGELNIYEKTDNNTEVLKWQLKGDKGNKWLNGQVNVGSSKKSFQIIVDGVVGASYMADISIDDFEVKKGHCATLPKEADVMKPVTTLPPVTTQPPISCVEMNTDYFGNDLNGCAGITSTWQLCSSLCGKASGCKFWTWIGYNKHCCTKYGKGKVTKNKNQLVSGSANCGVPSPGPLDCDFDKALCANWKQEKTRDQMDFTWAKGSTASVGTGPKTDHTQGTKDGGYMYLETSNVKANASAQLISAEQSSTGAAQKCFVFHYHMFGPDVNTLNVYVSVHNKIGNPVWTKSGTLGDRWHRGSVNIHARDKFNIVIEATTGSNYRGDIAIDDVSLGTQPCPQMRHSCDFETDWCGYTLAPIDSYSVHFQWKKVSKRTDGQSTGPPIDHTLQSDSGFYVYAPATSPRKRGDVAAIISPEIAATPGSCLHFWYYMSGSNMGGLAIYLKRKDIVTYPPKWTENGDKGAKWRVAQITIESPTDDFQLYISSKLGGSTGSDIAIDDISIWDEPCTPKGSCNFEGMGTCTWQNSKSDDFDWTVHSSGTPSSLTGPAVDHTVGSAAGCIEYNTDYYGNDLTPVKGRPANSWPECQALCQQTTGCMFWTYGSVCYLKWGNSGKNSHSGATSGPKACAIGHYIYMESSVPRKPGDVAILESEQFSSSATGKSLCLEFWYHMYGANIGNLSIIHQLFTGAKKEILIWQLGGQQQTSQKDAWRYARVPVKMDADNVVRIKGTVGSSYLGDLAVDDILFTSLVCTISPKNADPNPPPPPTKPPTFPKTLPPTIPTSDYNCDFERDFCKLTMDTSATFKWRRKQGFTDTPGTGPSHDHTKGIGVAGDGLPGSIKHSSGKCIHVQGGAHNLPADNTKLVFYNGCGQERLEFILGKDGYMKLTKWNLCVNAIGGAKSGAQIGIAKCTSSSDKWRHMTYGSFQHVGTNLCWSPSGGLQNPRNGVLLVIYKTCDKASRLFSWTPTAGWYAFIEASAPRKFNDTARMLSPLVNKQGGCLTFWYHMWGPHVNRLSVYLKASNSSTLGKSVWSMIGTKGDKWKPASVALTVAPPYQYVIEAVRGQSYLGDIAIDDIAMTTSCPGSLECHFEQPGSAAFCGWTNLKTDDFDWTIASGETASKDTGPRQDHTFRNSLGKYMYIETSIAQPLGHKAVLESGNYPSNGFGGGGCFQFWYHMYGASIGQLNIYRMLQGQTKGTNVWSRSGDQGQKWYIGQIYIISASPFKLQIEGIRGTSFTGDIAIDDMRMNTGACNKAGTCDFENDKCTWSNDVYEDKFDWTIGSGATPSVRTGPATDHTKGTGDGRYMFVEASPPQAMGDTARIESELFSAHILWKYCLRFWYFMYGASIGNLAVYIKTGPGQTNEKKIWELSGQRQRINDPWAQGVVTVSSSVSYQLVFEVTLGSGQYGDIALDDIVYSHSFFGCPIAPTDAVPVIPTTAAPITLAPTVPTPIDTSTWTICNDQQNSMANALVFGGWKTVAEVTKMTDAQKKAALVTDLDKLLTIKDLKTLDGVRDLGSLAGIAYITTVLRRADIFTVATFYKHGAGRCDGTGNWANTNWIYVPGLMASATDRGVSGRTEGWCRETCRYMGECRFFTYTPNSGKWCYLWKGLTCTPKAYGAYTIYKKDDSSSQIKTKDYHGVRNSLISDLNKKTSEAVSKLQGLNDFTLSRRACYAYRAPVQYDCDFESSSCSWKQDVSDQFDWTRQNGSTSSLDTGPSRDHTLGTSAGHYMYIETSGVLKDGDTARLICPKFDTIGASQKEHCLSFWFHMWGRHINALRIYLKTTGGEKKYWERVGDNGDVWRQAQVSLPVNEDYQIVIEGVRGTSFNGDISIDDLKLSLSECPSPKVCDFEHGMCDYVQDPKAAIQWTRHRGATTSVGTGPKVDHTLGSAQGWYLYVEMSGILSKGASARIIGPVFDDSSAKCIRFWYHMRGFHMGSFNVYVQTGSGRMPIFKKSGNHGDQWLVAQTSMRPRTGRQLVFEGVRGAGYAGDIAIDDLRVMDGYCPPAGDCNFEDAGHGMCTWTNQQTGDDFDWIRASKATLSALTGPTTDHTRGDATGFYMFIETSFPRNNGDIAMLQSETFSPSISRCLQFWYHMRGSDIGQLDVFTRNQNGTKTLVWSLTGAQGDKWMNGQVPVRSQVDYQVVFQGMRGTGYSGDIALDDIVFTNFVCKNSPPSSIPPNPPTTAAPPPTTRAPLPDHNCNFTTDKCAWTDDTSTLLKWQRQRGKTPSEKTGPTNDHTTGGVGWYLYLETSLPQINETARLISPSMPTATKRCVQFWYHMYGDHVGELNVKMLSGSTEYLLWTRKGTHGDRWRHGLVAIQSQTSFKIVFEGVVGNGYAGDIALDDIAINDGACPMAAECTFEESTLCGWQNMAGDNYDWTRDNAGTSSSGTGPIHDHTYGTARGYYMYIESSVPRSKGHKAWLISKPMTPLGVDGRCLTFWYHMYGTHIGELNVLVYENGTRSAPIWQLSGNQGDVWRPSRVTINAGVTHQIIFEGRTGASYLGDIAIDDVAITAGKCPDPGNCDFERDTCGYQNMGWASDFDWLVGNGGTASIGTGPATDHSTNTKFGSYYYVEASIPQKENEMARIESEVVPVWNVGKCVTFWYHMFGTHIGQLNVAMEVYETDPSVAQSGAIIWSLRGDQGNQWKQAQVPFISRGQTMTIIFQGIRGHEYQGDIAIDDIIVLDYSGSCPLLPSNAQPLGCNFEMDTCGWTQSKSDKFDWTRHHGGTSTFDTGPSIDHTTNTTDGYYMFIETSVPRQPNETATLIGPKIPAQPLWRRGGKADPYCMFFTYHMYGPDVDKLTVRTRANYKDGPIVWQRTGTQGPNWVHGFVNLQVKDDTQVLIEGRRGQSYKGDIAIDDIDIEYGECLYSGFCSFESAKICGWYRFPKSTTNQLYWDRNAGPTPSLGTGPSTDHSTGTAFGHYMYVEVSGTEPVNAKGTLRTPWFYNYGQTCAQFFYHMNGAHIGKLQVIMRQWTLTPVVAFERVGTQNDTWWLGQVSTSRVGYYQLDFVVVKGAAWQGDIAIDDFRLRDGACPGISDCDFEHGDTCTWRNSKGDNFDWVLEQGNTLSLLTGPKTDHTTGTGAGYYVFIESSVPRVAGDAAVLNSQLFPATVGSGRCLAFWYHMKGSGIGSLNVYVATYSGTTLLLTELMWQLNGNQADAWLLARVPLKSATSYQIFIKAIRGTSYLGDIALDDIEFTDQACALSPASAWPKGKPTPAPTKPATTVGPTSGNAGNDCNFEVDFCPNTWTQNSTFKSFVWHRHKGATASYGTGPSIDHTRGTDQGYYTFVESSAPASKGDKSWLQTTIGSNPSGFCLSFYYHMYGAHVGTINVRDTTTIQWTRTGTQGDQWRHGQAYFAKSAGAVPIIFEAVRGDGYMGDIALDDISFGMGTTCPTAKECDFEGSVIPWCGWGQDTTQKDDFDWLIGSGATTSYLTGPTTDHTLQTKLGHYMYIETSYPRKHQQLARLVTTTMQKKTNGRCLIFWYHMYGATIGNLTIYTRLSATGSHTTRWSRTGNHGNKWFPGMVELKSINSDYQVAIEATTGTSYTGDIALDDIAFIDGNCPLPGHCTFESFGFCTFTQEDKEDDLDWIRGSGSTLSFQTGPSTDFTTKSKYGHYVFLESSHPAKPGQKARLNSEELPATGTKGVCLEFYRHMWGAHIGTLNVYVKYQTGNGKTSERMVWTNSGQQGKSWVHGRAPIVSTARYRIVFEATIGNGYQGDIALDDIALNANFYGCSHIPSTAVPITPAPTTILPHDSNCTFETGTTCRWSQVTTDQFNWRMASGKTASLGTGPLGDHTTGNGKYIFIETSLPRKPKDKAQLLSSSIRPVKGVTCFQFWFHMHGHSIGSLNIYKVINGKSTLTWTRSGTQGAQWRRGQIGIINQQIFQLMIEGVTGPSWGGDIALDDLVLTDGRCPPSPYCDFERNQCGWANTGTQGDNFNWKRHNGGTPSYGTGPKTDHTTGTKLGNYMYIETSVPAKNGDKAWLFSKKLPASAKGSCFNFWYHMSGSHIGALNIFIDTAKTGLPIWNKTGHQSDSWIHGRATVKSAKEFKIVFEGIVGASYMGDIAIDDLWIDDVPCPAPGACSFEGKSFCTWQQIQNRKMANDTGWNRDDFDFELGSGSTPSIGTGPKFDHTLGTSLGTYAFIETSGVRTKGLTSRLVSETFSSTTATCFKFFTHRNGYRMGDMNIYLYDPEYWQETLELTITGDQGDVWVPQEVTLVSRRPYKVIIEALQGDNYRGDVSLDDLSFTPGNCVGLCSSITPTARVLCGPYKVSAGSCVATYGCCYDDSIANMPKCFHHPGSCEGVKPILRQQCGSSGIKKTSCTSMGCCFDETVTSGFQCYHYASKPTDHPRTLPPKTYPPKTKYDCDFEKNQCGYANMGDDQHSWLRNQGGTPSWGTGPTVDHTTMTDKGWYMYMEATNVKENATANFRTPFIDFATGGNSVCVEFYYHMYGSHVGTLNVYSKYGSTLSSPKTLLWSKSGTRPDAWQYAQITVARSPKFQIVFQGIRSVGYQGDIAIDDVAYINGECQESDFCGFENNFCGYEQDASDDFDWSRGHANTTSLKTGPALDTTYGTAYGKYIYIEGSYPRQPGDKARLESFEIERTTGLCVEFMYHMYGKGIGTLNVYLRRNGLLESTPVWTMSGNQGNEWYRAQITVIEPGPWKFMLEAIRGATYESDIAIDDAHLHYGECIPQGDCTFDRGHGCGYKNDPNNSVDWILYWGQTPSHRTGPSTDHTTGSKYGMYLYMESSYPAQEGDIARYESEKFKINPNYKWCINFWYHMYGLGVGKLSLKLKYRITYSDGETRTYRTAVWETSGQKVNKWLFAAANVTMSYDFQIVFEGVVGKGVTAMSDIAIDDILVVTGECAAPTPPPKPNPCGMKCYDGSCVASDKICDFYPDCAKKNATDYSDEAHCDGCDFETEKWVAFPTKGEHCDHGFISETSGKTTRDDCFAWCNLQKAVRFCNHMVAGGTYCMAFSQCDKTTISKYKGQVYQVYRMEGTCGWSDSSKGAFDWNWQQGRTASVNTGPSKDHTTGTALGHYMYVEASVGTSQSIAELDGPLIAQSSATCALEFWYHMYGTSIGELNVYLQEGIALMRMWTLSGDQGNQWHRAVVYLMRRRTPFKIKFEGVRGFSYAGDIAIDDVKMVGCALPGPADYCSQHYAFSCDNRACVASDRICDFTDDCGDNSDENNCPWVYYPYRETFEHGMGYLEQLNDDEFDWTRSKGMTASISTGPMFDHTTGSGNGWYIYTEASWPRSNGDRARLASPVLLSMGPYYGCRIRFYYHMFGDHIGTLRIKMRTCLGCREKLLWETSGHSGNYWLRHVVFNYQTEPFQFIIESDHGTGYMGDIALDDISFQYCRSSYDPLPTLPPTTTSAPTTSPCDSNKFYCAADARCIEMTHKCDFHADCSDGQDELHCGPCDFATDTCGYQETGTGRYGFTRIQTSSTQTKSGRSYRGPSTDASGKSDGYVAMTDYGSGSQNTPAILTSAALSATGAECVVEIAYYSNSSKYNEVKLMHGQNSTVSTIYVGNFWGGDKWVRKQIGVGGRPAGWRLMFSAMPNDIAIDDVKFINCSLPMNRYGRCPRTHMGCDNGACFRPDRLCDLADDCGDWSDEKSAVCSSYTERCSFQYDLCGWYQSKSDVFDWIRQTGRTDSVDTGPGADHTTGTVLGHYLYVETSYQRVNDTARLHSVVFTAPQPGTGICQMRFFYHMYGNAIGTLNIWQSFSVHVESHMKNLWSLSGDQGDIWRRGEITITSTTNYQIVIEAIAGEWYQGDIALDDISFTPGCLADRRSTLSPDYVTITPPPGCKSGEFGCDAKGSQCIPYDQVCDFKYDCTNKADEAKCPASCNFETDTCKWRNNRQTDVMDWTRHQGMTPTNTTGPDRDHTTNKTSGWYMFVEAGQRKSGSFPNAQFVSPMYHRGAYVCKLTFWYMLYNYKGNDARLNVYYLRNGKQTLLGFDDWGTSKKWEKAALQLPNCPNDFQIVFEARHWYATTTDAAIDDIAMDCMEPTVVPKCAADEFRCTKTEQCVKKTLLCDLDHSCCDGSDEDRETICKYYPSQDFESGLQGWIQLRDDDFDYKITSGSTVSTSTGPKTDHTLQEEHGKYAYIEASSPRKMNETARLASATIDATSTSVSAGDACTMRFWYHMSGSHIGELAVYAATTYGAVDNKLWMLAGDQGYAWRRADVTLTSAKPFQVIIEGKIGSSYAGDIAIDDITFTPQCVFVHKQLPGGPTIPPVNPCGENFQCPSDLHCLARTQVCDFEADCRDSADESSCGNPLDFEKGFNNWVNAHNADYAWERNNGSTGSTGTGPSTDAKGDKNGFYAFLEVSNRLKDKKAILGSPTFGQSYSKCHLDFWYHMKGRDCGSLTIDLITRKTDVTTLWTVSGEQGSSWIHGQTYIGRREQAFAINITATVGSGYTGDIAIDEISLKNCEPPPKCSGGAGGQFICGNGRCIDSEQVCDFMNDCGDRRRSDENFDVCGEYTLCNFEKGAYCNWTQDTNDDFDWTRSTGKTASINTGPTRDHTYGTALGTFMYIEASGRWPKDKARLFGEEMKAKVGGSCEMRMSYHMFGEHVDDLIVRVKRGSTSTFKKKLTGNFGDMWYSLSVDLKDETEKFRVEIEGVVGQSYLGDIAIDDIIFTPDCLRNGSKVFPTGRPCDSDQFTCSSHAQCVAKDAQCNGIDDCKDGSDEQGCGTGVPTTAAPNCFEENMNYNGEDLPPIKYLPVSDAVSCQALCARRVGCLFWTLTPKGCLLKNGSSNRVPTTGYTSGPNVCPTYAPKTEAQKGGGGAAGTNRILAAGVGGGIVLLIIIILIVYVIVKRKRSNKMQLFSVFYDPTKQPPEEPKSRAVSEKKQSAGRSPDQAGVSNPIYDVGGQARTSFAMGELDSTMFSEDVDMNDMFVDESFTVPIPASTAQVQSSKSMANPLYQDPYMEDDDSPLSGF